MQDVRYTHMMMWGMQALHPLFGAGEEAGVRDNAAGAVGRLLRVFGGAVPLEAVAPVLLAALPLTEVGSVYSEKNRQ